MMYLGGYKVRTEFVTDQLLRDQKALKRAKKLMRRAIKIFTCHLELYPAELKWLKDAERFLNGKS